MAKRKYTRRGTPIPKRPVPKKAGEINWDEIEDIELASSIADKLNLSYATIRAWCLYRYGHLLPSTELNGHLAIQKSDLKAFLEKRDSNQARVHGKSSGKGFRIPSNLEEINWDKVKDYLTIAEIAELFGMSVPGVSRWLQIGLPSHKVGKSKAGMKVIKKSELIAFLNGEYEVTPEARAIIDRTRNWRKSKKKGKKSSRIDFKGQ